MSVDPAHIRQFDSNRQLVDGPPCEFWDDAEYMPSMDKALYYVLNPEKSEFPDAARRQQVWWKSDGSANGGD